MKTKPKDDVVISILNEVLTAELTAINQYFIHSELCAHWGYAHLHKEVRKQSIHEMKHAEKVMERILYLDGLPNMQRLGKVNIGESVKEQFEVDLKLEQEAIVRLTDGIKICTERADYGSRLLLEEILISEEEHVDWIHAQMTAIEQTGYENFLSTQIRVA
jgi:bacterioferritin